MLYSTCACYCANLHEGIVVETCRPCFLYPGNSCSAQHSQARVVTRVQAEVLFMPGSCIFYCEHQVYQRLIPSYVPGLLEDPTAIRESQIQWRERLQSRRQDPLRIAGLGILSSPLVVIRL